MNRVWIAVAATMLTSVGIAQDLRSLYTPVRSVGDQGISLKSWGSGTASETDETSFQGNSSIRISTKNFFQGGLLLYKAGVDLSKAFETKTNLLRFTFKSVDSNATLGGTPGGGGAPSLGGIGGPAGGGGGLKGGGAGGGIPGGGQKGGSAPGGQQRGAPSGPPPGFRPPTGPGGGIVGGGFGGSTASPTTLKTVRVIIHTTDNKWSEAYINLTASSTSQGWNQIAVPLGGITGFDRTNKVIDRIGFGGDATATFYIGEMAILSDTTPVRGDVNARSLNLANGDEFTFVASGSGGASVLKYSWDFDSTDGIQEDATGQVVKRKFRKAGKYTITLTVSDEFGLKTPYTILINCTVNP